MTEQNMNTEKSTEKPRFNGGKMGALLLTLLSVIFICLLGYGYFALSKINIELAQMVTDSQNRTTTNHNTIIALQKSVDEMQQSIQKSQDLSSQQEQLMSEWRAAQKGDLNKWHIAEAQYLVNLANDHLQYTHNVKMSVILLTRADQILDHLQDPNVLEIRKSLATDLANIQAVPLVDTTSLYLRVAALDSQMDQLPLPLSPLKTDNLSTPNLVTSPADSWWKQGLNRSWQMLQKIVVIRRNDAESLPLVLPDEKIFLYQNLHAQMEAVMWSVLQHNAEVYQANLDRTMAWIKQYFAQDKPTTTAMLQSLEELRKINVQPPMANLSETLKMFDTYFAQAQQTPAQTQDQSSNTTQDPNQSQAQPETEPEPQNQPQDPSAQ